MMCAFGNTSHSTRNTTSNTSCAVRTPSRPRRSRLSQSRYCGLAVISTVDMNLELLPQRVEIAVELRRIAGRERRRAPAIGRREADRVIRFHPPRPAREDDHPLRHADRLADVVGDQDRGLALAPQNLRHL